jgi:hypothetical protein
MYVDELDLEQLLADPLTRLVMKSDAVEESDIRQLAAKAGVRRRTLEQQAFSPVIARPPFYGALCGYPCAGFAH